MCVRQSRVAPLLLLLLLLLLCRGLRWSRSYCSVLTTPLMLRVCVWLLCAPTLLCHAFVVAAHGVEPCHENPASRRQ